MNRWRATCIVLAFWLIARGPAIGQKPENSATPGGPFQACTGKGPPAERIAGCTELLKTSRAKNPTRAAYLNTRGRAYYQDRRYDQAIDDFSEAIRLNPKNPESYFNRGDAYDEKGEFDRAIADYDESLRLRPGMPVVHNNRGLAYSHKRDYERAIEDYSAALHLQPDYADAYTNRGIAYFKKQDMDRAARDFEQSLAWRLQNPKAFFNLGTVNYIRGNYAQAVQNIMAGASFAGLDRHRALHLFAARSRAGMDTQELMQYLLPRMDLDAWPGQAFKLFSGQITPEALRSLDTRGHMGQALWTCEMNYVLGLFALSKGNTAAARAHFRSAAASGADEDVPLLHFARAELKRLGPP